MFLFLFFVVGGSVAKSYAWWEVEVKMNEDAGEYAMHRLAKINMRFIRD